LVSSDSPRVPGVHLTANNSPPQPPRSGMVRQRRGTSLEALPPSFAWNFHPLNVRPGAFFVSFSTSCRYRLYERRPAASARWHWHPSAIAVAPTTATLCPRKQLLTWAPSSSTAHMSGRRRSRLGIFLYLFYNFFIFILSRLCKNIWPATNFAKYTSAAVAHGVRDITSWPTAVGAARSGPLAWDRHSVVPHGVRGLAPWATTLGPSTVGHGGSRPASAVGHAARVWLPI
jgi:hypothetical protein